MAPLIINSTEIVPVLLDKVTAIAFWVQALGIVFFL